MQNTVTEIAHDLDLPESEIRYRVAGVNHVAFFLDLSHEGRSLYPALREGYRTGRLPKPPLLMPRCANKVRYEVMEQLGYFCTESSEHLAEYVPWFIKEGREDLIESFQIPLDEYPKRCEEQIAGWAAQAGTITDGIAVEKSHEFAADLMAAVVENQPYTIYGNLPNKGQCRNFQLVQRWRRPASSMPTAFSPQASRTSRRSLSRLMRSQINVQELTVRALLDEAPEHIYHAAMMDPHTAAELDLRQIRRMVDDLLAAHGDWLPDWCRPSRGRLRWRWRKPPGSLSTGEQAAFVPGRCRATNLSPPPKAMQA